MPGEQPLEKQEVRAFTQPACTTARSLTHRLIHAQVTTTQLTRLGELARALRSYFRRLNEKHDSGAHMGGFHCEDCARAAAEVRTIPYRARTAAVHHAVLL